MQPARTNKTFSCFMSSDLNFFHCCLNFFQMRWVHIRKGFILSKCSLSLLWGHCLSACFPRVQQLCCRTRGSRSQQRLVLSWGTSRGRYADGRAPCWSCSVSLLWRFRVSSHNTLVCALSFTVNLPRGDLIISRRMQARFTLESHLQVYFLRFIIHVFTWRRRWMWLYHIEPSQWRHQTLLSPSFRALIYAQNSKVWNDVLGGEDIFFPPQNHNK